MHPLLVNRVLFPLHERLKGKRTHARLRELERTQWLAPAELQEPQLAQLRRPPAFAYREVPYHTRLLDENGVHPSRITSLRDFAPVPCLAETSLTTSTAEAIRSALAALMGPGVTVDVEPVECIVRPASGKRRYVVSRVADSRLDGLPVAR